MAALLGERRKTTDAEIRRLEELIAEKKRSSRRVSGRGSKDLRS
jgi:hypothetical protein